MHAINWPVKFTPGTTDNFVSNEVIVQGLTAAEVWTYLNDTSWWCGYYQNVSQIEFDAGVGPRLSTGCKFRFTTFVFPVEAEVVEWVEPTEGKPGRMAWTGLITGDADHKLDVLHAWLIEDLPGGRVRVLTQESQIGKPAQEMAVARPNPMLNAHQAWLDGLVSTALKHARG
jgi:hypothetical protein